MKLITLYHSLLCRYGQQGWWPLIGHKGENPAKTGSARGYHPGEYSCPKNENERFEICVGAILTQNTSWVNAEKALLNLKKRNILTPEKILSSQKLADALKPSGYFNQKARKLKEFSFFYVKLKGKIPSRKELLSVWGIGEETADSILLYAYGQPEFVVDAYTKRIGKAFGFLSGGESYLTIKELFEKNLPRDFRVYQEFHALIVEEGKRGKAV